MSPPSTTPQQEDIQSTPAQPHQPEAVEPAGEDLSSATPRDVRLLHLIMASMGVTSYQDRVPLQLMDFAYRYTHGVLQDALLYNDHAHANPNTLPAGVGPTNSPVTIDDIRLSVAARTNYQFKPAPPKELLLEMAQERNKRPLPAISQTWGLRLPPEKYCLTSKEWDFKEEPEQVLHETEVRFDQPQEQDRGEIQDQDRAQSEPQDQEMKQSEENGGETEENKDEPEENKDEKEDVEMGNL